MTSSFNVVDMSGDADASGTELLEIPSTQDQSTRTTSKTVRYRGKVKQVSFSYTSHICSFYMYNVQQEILSLPLQRRYISVLETV